MKPTILAAALFVAGCANQNTQTAVYAAATALTAADEAAIAYVTLPTCAAHPAPCASPSVVADIKAKATAARAAVKAAEKAGDNPSLALANAAVAALTAAVPAKEGQ